MSEESKPGETGADETGAEGTFEGAGAEGSVKITHANQLRSAKFREMTRKKSTWAWIIGLSVLAGLIFAGLGFPAAGGGVFVLVFLGSLLVVFMIADGRAEDAFFDYYCETHGLTRSSSPEIGELTPLLRMGDKTNTDEMFSGELAPGLSGDLVLYTYTEVHRDSDGDETETDYPFTIIHVEMPEIVQHMTDLQVHRAGFKLLDGIQDKFLGDMQRVTLESEVFAKRFEVFVSDQQDPVWTRRLFSPSFIVWLTENPPDSFAFELEDGHLVAYVSRHMDSTETFENVTRVGTYVADRLLKEVAESSPKAERETRS